MDSYTKDLDTTFLFVSVALSVGWYSLLTSRNLGRFVFRNIDRISSVVVRTVDARQLLAHGSITSRHITATAQSLHQSDCRTVRSLVHERIPAVYC